MAMTLMVAGWSLTSCNTDNIGETYKPDAQNITFLTSEQSASTGDTETEVKVRIARSNTAAAYTANVTIESEEDDVFTIEGGNSVTFPAGQGYVDVVVKAANMDRGNSYEATMKLSAADIETADETVGNQIPEVTITVTCDYTWTSYGIGHFVSEAFEDEWDVEVMKAEEGEIYKCLDLYTTGKDVIFVCDGDKVTVDWQQAWMYSSEYGWVYVGGEGTRAGNTLTVLLEHYEPYDDYSYGKYTAVLTLPE